MVFDRGTYCLPTVLHRFHTGMTSKSQRLRIELATQSHQTHIDPWVVGYAGNTLDNYDEAQERGV